MVAHKHTQSAVGKLYHLAFRYIVPIRHKTAGKFYAVLLAPVVGRFAPLPRFTAVVRIDDACGKRKYGYDAHSLRVVIYGEYEPAGILAVLELYAYSGTGAQKAHPLFLYLRIEADWLRPRFSVVRRFADIQEKRFIFAHGAIFYIHIAYLFAALVHVSALIHHIRSGAFARKYFAVCVDIPLLSAHGNFPVALGRQTRAALCGYDADIGGSVGIEHKYLILLLVV